MSLVCAVRVEGEHGVAQAARRQLRQQRADILVGDRSARLARHRDRRGGVDDALGLAGAGPWKKAVLLDPGTAWPIKSRRTACSATDDPSSKKLRQITMSPVNSFLTSSICLNFGSLSVRRWPSDVQLKFKPPAQGGTPAAWAEVMSGVAGTSGRGRVASSEGAAAAEHACCGTASGSCWPCPAARCSRRSSRWTRPSRP